MRRYFLICIALLAMCGSAHGVQIVNITGAAGNWPTTADGTVATTTTTGFAAISASKWTHKTFAANTSVTAPVTSSAVGWIESAAGAASCTFDLESGTQRCTGNSGAARHYWQRFYVMLHPTVTPKGGVILNCANNGAGLIRVTTSVPHNLTTGDGVFISEVEGTTEANSAATARTVTVIDATNFDLQGTTFTNAYTYVSNNGVWGTMPNVAANQNFCFYAAGTATYIRCDTSGQGNVILAGGPNSRIGWQLWQATGASHGTQTGMNSMGASQNNAACVPWDTWAEVCIHWMNSSATSTTDGLQEIYINGCLVSSLPLDAETTGASFETSGFSFIFPYNAWPNMVCRVCGPFETWTDTDITLRPRFDFESSTSEVKKWFLPYLPALTGTDTTQGKGWSYTTDTGTVVYRDYYTDSTIQGPNRGRLYVSGSASVNNITSVDQIGSLTYNTEGYASICFSDLLVPGTGTLTISLTDSGDSVLKTWTINAGSGTITSPGSDTLTWTAAKRYSLMIHLKSDGTATFTLLDVTTDGSTVGTQIVWSQTVTSGWTPQALGKIKLVATPSTTTKIEIGQVEVCTYPTLVGIDSNTTTLFSGGTLVANLWVADDIGAGLPFGQEFTMLPGGWYPQKENGHARRHVVAFVGRTNMTTAAFLENVVSGMAKTRGVRLMLLDGSLQDIYGRTGGGEDVPYTIGSTTSPTARAKQVAGNIASIVNALSANDCKVNVATMGRRTRKVNITSATKANPVVLTVEAGHGLITGGIRVTVQGVTSVPAANGVVSAATVSGNSVTLVGVNGSASGDGGATAGTITEFYENESQSDLLVGTTSYIDQLAHHTRTKLQLNANSLLTMSDILADQLANPTNYLNNRIFWVSLQQYKIQQSAYYVARRILDLEQQVYSPAPPQRRLPGSLVGRN